MDDREFPFFAEQISHEKNIGTDEKYSTNLQSKRDLDKPVHDLLFGQRLSLLTETFVEITSRAVRHDDVQHLVFVLERLAVRDDVRVTELAK